jgi:hypothetical protein
LRKFPLSIFLDSLVGKNFSIFLLKIFLKNSLVNSQQIKEVRRASGEKYFFQIRLAVLRMKKIVGGKNSI